MTAPITEDSGPSETHSSAEPSADPAPPRTTRRDLSLLGSLVLALVGAAFVWYGIRSGMSASGAVLAVVAVALTQVLPGALVWRLVRPRHGWWAEDIAMGFAIGSVLAVAAQVVAGLTRLPWLSGGIGLAVASGLLLAPATRGRVFSARTSPLPWWWGSIVAATSLTALLFLESGFRRVPLEPGLQVARADQYHHLAVAGQLATRGPTTFPWVESEPLGYHWFSHAWVAQVSNASGAELDEVLFRFLPLIMPLALVLVVATAAVRLSGRPWTGPVAAILTLAGGNLNVFGKISAAHPIAPLSPSVMFAAPLLVGTVTVIALRWRGQLQRSGIVLVAVLGIGAAGSKGSTAPLIVAGLGLATMAMLIVARSRLRSVLIDLVIVVACLLFTLVAVIRGAGESLQIDPSAAASQTRVAGWVGGVRSAEAKVFALVVAVTAEFTRAVGVFGLLATKRGRRDPLTWLLLGASVAGAAAVGVFTHAFGAQGFFATSAAPLMALGSTLGLVVLVDKLGPRARNVLLLAIVAGPVVALAPVALLGPLDNEGIRRASAMLAVAVIVVVLVAVVAAVVVGRRLHVVASVVLISVLAAGMTVFARSLIERNLPPQPSAVDVNDRGAVSRGQIDAARWIRDHSDVDDVVMTNRHCNTPAPRRKCDSRRFSVAAYSERQVLVEGWTYTPMAVKLAPSGRDYITVDYWEPELLALNDGFITQPTEDAADELRQRGVRWVFVDDTVRHARTLGPFAALRFQAPGVDVYELPAGS